MNVQKLNRIDILLAIIAAAGAKGLSSVQLQKIVFLVSEECAGKLPKDFYNFDKYDYGPFCIDIYNDVEMLHDWGLLHIHSAAQRRDDAYSIAAPPSFERPPLDAAIIIGITDTVSWVLDMPFDELLRAVYLLYPEYLKNSRFKYSEEEAMAESFARSFKQIREGKVHDGWEALAELKREAETRG